MKTLGKPRTRRRGSRATQHRRVVITGLGAVSPLGQGVDAMWSGLLAGRSGIRQVPALDSPHSHCQVAGVVDDAFGDGLLSAKDRQRLNRAAQMGIVATEEAIAQAGWDPEAVDRSRVGVFMGCSASGFACVEGSFSQFCAGRPTHPLSVPLFMNSSAAAALALRFGLHGPTLTVDTACASSLHALGQAFYHLQSGLVDMALAGGAETTISASFFAFWSGLRALSQRNDSPETACRPFSADRDGLVLGEGAAILVLETAESAARRGATILAEVVGHGASCDGYHLTQPSMAGPAAAMAAAIRQADLCRSELGFVIAHGTGTPLNDANETKAIRAALGAQAERAPVVSLKGGLGHWVAACGAVNVVAAVMAIQDGQIPPTINYSQPDPECDLDYVVHGSRSWTPGPVLANAFGFGGSNASLIIQPFA